MLKIRLQRVGRKHEPTFRLVLTDSKNSTKSGRFLEILGSHDSRGKDTTTIKTDRALHWIKMGAKLTDTVHNLFINHKIIEGKKINVLPKKTVEKKPDETKPEQAKPEQAKLAQAETAKAEVEATAEETKVEEAAPAEAPSA